jgi:hypothetical protein
MQLVVVVLLLEGGQTLQVVHDLLLEEGHVTQLVNAIAPYPAGYVIQLPNLFQLQQAVATTLLQHIVLLLEVAIILLLVIILSSVVGVIKQLQQVITLV